MAATDPAYPAKEYEGGTITSVISDVKIDNVADTITLLIEISDTNALNTTYRDHKTRSGRHIEKDIAEGNGFSAHVVISTKPEKAHPNTYLCIVEVMPTVSVYRVQSILNSAIKTACSISPNGIFTFLKPGGGKKLATYVPHIVLSGHPSDQFLADIENGTINGLQLVESAGAAQLSQSSYLESKEAIVKFKVSKSIPIGQRITTFVSGLGAHSKKYPVTRISVQPERGGKSFHIDIETGTGNLISEAYTKCKRIGGINPPLETTSPDSIVAHLDSLIKATVVGARRP